MPCKAGRREGRSLGPGVHLQDHLLHLRPLGPRLPRPLPDLPLKRNSVSIAVSRFPVRRSFVPSAVGPSSNVCGIEWVIEAHGCAADSLADVSRLESLFD